MCLRRGCHCTVIQSDGALHPTRRRRPGCRPELQSSCWDVPGAAAVAPSSGSSLPPRLCTELQLSCWGVLSSRPVTRLAAGTPAALRVAARRPLARSPLRLHLFVASASGYGRPDWANSCLATLAARPSSLPRLHWYLLLMMLMRPVPRGARMGYRPPPVGSLWRVGHARRSCFLVVYGL